MPGRLAVRTDVDALSNVNGKETLTTFKDSLENARIVALVVPVSTSNE